MGYSGQGRQNLWLTSQSPAFIIVPSMMPRPVLKESFGVAYRKIPVLAIGKEVRFTAFASVCVEKYPPGFFFPVLSDKSFFRSIDLYRYIPHSRSARAPVSSVRRLWHALPVTQHQPATDSRLRLILDRPTDLPGNHWPNPINCLAHTLRYRPV